VLSKQGWDESQGRAPIDLTLTQPLELPRDLFSFDNGRVTLQSASLLQKKLQKVGAFLSEQWSRRVEEAKRQMAGLDIVLEGVALLRLNSPFGVALEFAGVSDIENSIRGARPHGRAVQGLHTTCNGQSADP
jgi:hypothetical protein